MIERRYVNVDGERRLLERDIETGEINQLFRKATVATRPHIDRALLKRLWDSGQPADDISEPHITLPKSDQEPDALRQIRVLLAALEEVAAYDQLRQHNQPPPALWLESKSYIRDAKQLLAELRQLDEQLKQEKRAGNLSKATTAFGHTMRKFLDNYADTMGKGAAALTIGAAAVLLANLGLPKERGRAKAA